MSRETERDLAAMVRAEKRAKEIARAQRDDVWKHTVDLLKADNADLRRQVAEERMRASAAEFAVAQLRADARRERDAVKVQAAELRRQLDAVPREEIDDLYTAYAYATAGSEVHARFPDVGRWLGLLPDIDDTPPHRPGKGE